MNPEKLSFYVSKGIALYNISKSIDFVAKGLSNYTTSVAMLIKTLKYIGYSIDEIDTYIVNSDLWKQYTGTPQDLFFDLLEIDEED